MIKSFHFQHKTFNFPVGEMQVSVFTVAQKEVSMEFIFEKNEDIIELLMVCDAIKRDGNKLMLLTMHYVPFGRQDRVAVSGEAFSLKVFCDLVNSLGFQHVLITDPHSDVTPALLNNCTVVTQDQVFIERLNGNKDFLLISPDGGALKKIYKLAKKAKVPVIECTKKRNVENGEVTETVVHADDLQGKDCVIVDDICDGGRTFIEIAKVLKTKNCGKIFLCVTHGFFTKGLQVFDGLIDEVYTMKGKVK